MVKYNFTLMIRFTCYEKDLTKWVTLSSKEAMKFKVNSKGYKFFDVVYFNTNTHNIIKVEILNSKYVF